MLPKDTLKERVAIITGGGTGLGKAMALEFARLGAKIVVASRKLENLQQTVSEIEKRGGEALAVPTDVRDPAQVENLVAVTKQRFGKIDILVNNAAGNFICRAEDLSANGWRAVVGIVLDGTFLVSDYASFITGETLVLDGGQWLGHGHYLGELERLTTERSQP